MKKFLLFAVVATLFAACTQDVAVEILSPNIADDAPETLTVGFEGDDTRIQLNENVKTVWTNGDQVSVFYRSDANQKWEYTGETGARIADLTRVDEGVATEDMKRVVVVYPYNENYYINTDTFNVQATLPAVQTYLKDSYGLNGNIMISQSEYNNFSLKSVCGWLKLQLTGNGEKIKSITLKGNNGEQVAGELYINSADATVTLSSDTGSADDGETGGAGGGLVFENTILKEVVLDCGNGVELGAEATSFYIALPPQTFTKGITVDITAVNGSTMTKSTDNEVVIERNHIKPMTAFGYNGIFKPANNEIYYTNGSTTEPTAPNDPAAFGDATIQSNTYDAERECWVITFDKDVTEIGESAFSTRHSLTSVTIGNSVTTIVKYAFYNCSSLTSVTIPDSVTTIEERAFSSCRNIKEFKGKFAADGGCSLIIDGVLNAFARGCGVTQYTIPDSVTTIGDDAFECCDLTSVTIPDSVTTIGCAAFEYCDSLTSVTIGNSVTTIGKLAFQDCDSLTSVTIGNSVTTIGEYAFCSCDSLTSVTIGNSVTTIGERAFSLCYSLTSVTIPDSVTTIGERAFYFCSSLKTVYCKRTTPPTGGNNMFDNNDSDRKIYVPASDDNSIINAYKKASGWSKYKDYIFEEGPANNEIWYTATVRVEPNKTDAFGATYVSNEWDAETGKGVITFDGEVTVIGEKAFYGYKTDCNKLISVTIPDSVTTIETSAFSECSSLECITIPEGVKTINSWAFYYCKSLTSVTIPNSVTTIGEYAFEYCKSLTSVTIPNRVTSIADGVFAYCSLLTSVIIPDSVTSIGYQAFGWCSSLTAVSIPNRVTKIGDSAFSGCKSLKYVYCKRTTPPSLGGVTFGNEFSPTVSTSAFDNNASDRKILVPVGSGEAYKSARYWSEYADAIVEYEF